KRLLGKPRSPRKKSIPTVISTFTEKKKVFLYCSSYDKKVSLLESENGEDFHVKKVSFPLEHCHLVQLDRIDKGRFALINQNIEGLAISLSKDLKKWGQPFKVGKSADGKVLRNGALVPNYQKDGAYLMFLGGKRIKMATSSDAQKWDVRYDQILDIPVDPGEEIKIDLAQKLDSGILLCYRLIRLEKHRVHYRAHIALIDAHNPSSVIWRSNNPIWENPPELGQITFGGAIVYRSQIYSFWNTTQSGTVRVQYPIDNIPFQLPKDHVIALDRAQTNPVIYPRSQFHWESFATYNPAAFYAQGRVHILYRAQGPDLISSIGYASSVDGINIDERLESPIYVPQEVFESFQKKSAADVEQRYISGGGIAGCEDPRVTLIGERVYMTYVAFDGASPPRVALTSIHLDDFLAKRWNWEKPVLISPPGIVDKSAVIFPEKIKGKYVIMHRIFPNIQIDYTADLNFDGSRWLKEQDRISIRENMWDSRKIGAGAPPIKTAEGWLLIYYGVDDRDDRLYKMGAMLLDLEDPTKVLYRSSTPILEPEDWYENSGFKPGIVYPCGAVVLNKTLLVYYGGADCVVCVASRDLESFLSALKANHKLTLQKQTPLRIKNHAARKKSIKSYYHA
ncbi:MAG: hypothetical protein ACM3MG_08720, partial [Bacillota bacterium]